MITMSVSRQVFQWFAVRTKSNREAIATQFLVARGFETWCPRYFTANPEVLGKPIFAGYVFCRFCVSNRLPILSTPGVVNIVATGSVPCAIDDQELASLRVVLEGLQPVQPHEFLEVGDKVRITEGPLTGAEGYVVQRDCKLLVVSISLLQRSISVALQEHWLESLSFDKTDVPLLPGPLASRSPSSPQ